MAELSVLDAIAAAECRLNTWEALEPIARERRRQFEKWGEQHHQNTSLTGNWPSYADRARRYKTVNDYRVEHGLPAAWDDILLEEIYEALELTSPHVNDPGEYRLEQELIQSAAVIVAWVEDLRSRRGTG